MKVIPVNENIWDKSDSNQKSEQSQINIGKLFTVHGVHGEFKLKSHIKLEQANKLIGKSAFMNYTEFTIQKIRYQSVYLIVKFSEINSLEQAKEYVKNSVWINRKDLGKLPSDTYYVADLIGMTVVTMEGHTLGKLKNCISTGSNDVYIINTNKKNEEIMIPAIKDVIKSIDLESKTMVVKLLEGLV